MPVFQQQPSLAISRLPQRDFPIILLTSCRIDILVLFLRIQCRNISRHCFSTPSKYSTALNLVLLIFSALGFWFQRMSFKYRSKDRIIADVFGRVDFIIIKSQLIKRCSQQGLDRWRCSAEIEISPRRGNCSFPRQMSHTNLSRGSTISADLYFEPRLFVWVLEYRGKQPYLVVHSTVNNGGLVTEWKIIRKN